MKFPNNMTDVADLGIDYMGFIFYPKSPRYMHDALQKKQLDRLPASIQKVGVFVNETEEAILQQAQNFGLDVIQLHGNETPDLCKVLKQNKLVIFKAFSVDSAFNPESIRPYEAVVDYILLDTKTKAHGGSGKKFDWDILEKIQTKKPLILSGGIGPEDASEIKALNHLNIHALDLNSRFEDEPGLKNIKLLTRFLNELNS